MVFLRVFTAKKKTVLNPYMRKYYADLSLNPYYDFGYPLTEPRQHHEHAMTPWDVSSQFLLKELPQIGYTACSHPAGFCCGFDIKLTVLLISNCAIVKYCISLQLWAKLAILTRSCVKKSHNSVITCHRFLICGGNEPPQNTDVRQLWC